MIERHKFATRALTRGSTACQPSAYPMTTPTKRLVDAVVASRTRSAARRAISRERGEARDGRLEIDARTPVIGNRNRVTRRTPGPPLRHRATMSAVRDFSELREAQLTACPCIGARAAEFVGDLGERRFPNLNDVEVAVEDGEHQDIADIDRDLPSLRPGSIFAWRNSHRLDLHALPAAHGVGPRSAGG